MFRISCLDFVTLLFNRTNKFNEFKPKCIIFKLNANKPKCHQHLKSMIAFLFKKNQIPTVFQNTNQQNSPAISLYYLDYSLPYTF